MQISTWMNCKLPLDFNYKDINELPKRIHSELELGYS